jgi:hypothetical protein
MELFAEQRGYRPAPCHASFGCLFSLTGDGQLTAILEARTDKPMSILIGVLITFLVVILVLYLINMLPIDGRAKQIAQIVVIIIGVISLLKYLAVF